MKLNQIAIYCTVCQYKNITKAAEILGITQPAASYAIKCIEDEYGVKLISRKSHGFELTVEGFEFLNIAQQLMTHVNTAELSFRSLSDKYKTLRIGMPPMLSTVFFPKWEKNINKIDPEIKFIQHQYGSVALKEKLLSKDLDCGVFPSSVDDIMFNHIKVWEYRYVLAVAKKHPLAKRKKISIEDIKDEPFVVLDETFANNMETYSLFARHGLEPNIVVQTNQFSSMQKEISSGRCVGLIYETYIEPYNDYWVGIPLDEEQVPREINFYWNKDAYISSGLSALIDIIASVNWSILYK